MGEGPTIQLRMKFNSRVRLEFRGAPSDRSRSDSPRSSGLVFDARWVQVLST